MRTLASKDTHTSKEPSVNFTIVESSLAAGVASREQQREDVPAFQGEFTNRSLVEKTIETGSSATRRRFRELDAPDALR